MQLSKLAIAHGPVLRLMTRFFQGDKLTVVAFHRVLAKADGRSPRANPEWTLTEDLFIRVLETLTGHFRIVSEGDVLDYYSGKASLPAKALLVTFDDGWRDNFDYALAPLAKLRIPALFFISAGYVGSREYYWQEDLYARYATRFGSNFTVTETRAFAEAKLPVSDGQWNRQSLLGLIGALHQGPLSQREAALASLGRPAEEKDAERLFMDVAELRKMLGEGMSIGAHGLNHEPFARMPDPEDEARRSRTLLEDQLGMPIRSMSYPHGSFDAKVKEACRKGGFSLAFSSRPGSNGKPEDPFDIRRHFLPNWRLPRFPDTGPAGPSLDFDVLWDLVKNNHA